MLTWISVAAGGAIGAALRYGVNVATVAIWGLGFPIATLIVNILGSFILGSLVGLFTHYGTPSPEMRHFIVTGMLGAFTTFSTFSLDSVTLFERGEYGMLSFYILASVLLGIGAFFFGLFIIRTLFS
jgi:CrcB protein|tara:strand:- start:38569 stop:38949 length:381 start_codon:yes stop_codon:yes gene_type:complete